MNTFLAENMRKYFYRSNVIGSINKIRFVGKAEKKLKCTFLPKVYIPENSCFPIINSYPPPIKTVVNVSGIKFLHSDIKVPNFDKYREESTLKITEKNSESVRGRINKSSAVSFASAVVALYGAKAVTWQFVKVLAASAEVMAMAKIEIKLQDIPEGKTAVFKWRGKPLFIKHRTPDSIEREKNESLGNLRDPETDEARCKDENWLVVIGVCTHLGCIPIPDQGDFPGGFYCPCHGSHYDGAGRIRKGPAPSNLEVPEYTFINSATLLVG